MRHSDYFLLSVLFVALFGGPIVAGLYGFAREIYLAVPAIVILVYSTVRYHRDVRIEGYGVRKTASPLWSRRFVLEITLMPIALGLFFGLLEGWERTLNGLALGLSISMGQLVFELVERMYLRKALNCPGSSIGR